MLRPLLLGAPEAVLGSEISDDSDPDRVGRAARLVSSRLVMLPHGRAHADELPDAQFEVIHGAGYNPRVERPGDFGNTVARFLQP